MQTTLPAVVDCWKSPPSSIRNIDELLQDMHNVMHEAKRTEQFYLGGCKNQNPAAVLTYGLIYPWL